MQVANSHMESPIGDKNSDRKAAGMADTGTRFLAHNSIYGPFSRASIFLGNCSD